MKTVFQIFFVLILSALASGCSSPRYLAVTQGELQGLVKKQKDVLGKRYVIVPPSRLSLFAESEKGSLADSLVIKVGEFIKKNKYARVEKLLKSVNHDKEPNDDLNFCWALYHFFKSEYEEARDKLFSITAERYKCSKFLLLADCEYRRFCSEVFWGRIKAPGEI